MLLSLKRVAYAAVLMPIKAVKFILQNPKQSLLMGFSFITQADASFIKNPSPDQVPKSHPLSRYNLSSSRVWFVAWGVITLVFVGEASYMAFKYFKLKRAQKAKLKAILSAPKPEIKKEVVKSRRIPIKTESSLMVVESKKMGSAPKGRTTAALSTSSDHNQEKKRRKLEKKSEREQRKLLLKQESETHKEELRLLKLEQKAEAEAKYAAEKEAEREETFVIEERLSAEAKLEGRWRSTTAICDEKLNLVLYNPEKNHLKKPKPEVKACKKYSEELSFVILTLCQMAQTQNQLARVLSFTALLLVLPRQYLALSHIQDRKEPSQKANNRQIRYMLQHGTMELDAKTLFATANRNEFFAQSPLVRALEISFKQFQNNDLVSDDHKYFSWLRHKIVPFINLISQTELPHKHFALIKLLSFIGEYYNQSRAQRFAKGYVEIEGLTPEIAKLLRKIHIKIRNRTEHLHSQFFQIATNEQVDKFCQQLKNHITNEVADINDFNDSFTYSLRNYKRKSKLDPNAPEFKPTMQ